MDREIQSLSDEDLACRVQAGSLACFDELVTRHQDRVYHFLRLKTGQDQDAEDLTQTTFVAAFRAIDRYRSRYRFVTWLFAIARRQAISFYRRRPPTEPLAMELADLRTPDERMVSSDACGHVWRVARRVLTEDQVTALWLRYAEDLSQREMARAMGKSIPHIKVLLHRGRKRLADALRDSPPARAAVPVPPVIPRERIR